MNQLCLTVRIYSSGTTQVQDPANDLALAQDITFDTLYPGGLHGSASLFVPRDVTTDNYDF